MRTKILNLLLALLAISNFSFAQNKHFIHSVPFREATQKMYGEEDKQNLVFQPEMDRDLPSAKNLVTFSEQDLNNGKTVKFGMLMDDAKKSHFLRDMGKDLSCKTSDYVWVFVLDNFDATCNAKNIGKLKIKDNKFYFDNNTIIHKGFGAVERLSQLLGIDKFPEHIWLCEFDVKISKSNIFRPAYQPDVTKNDINKENNILFLKGKWHLAKKYLNNIKIDNTGNIKHLLPEQWLASLQQSKEYPWTRMGYTYDWGASEDNNVIGVSEFILVPNTQLNDIKFYKIVE